MGARSDDYSAEAEGKAADWMAIGFAPCTTVLTARALREYDRSHLSHGKGNVRITLEPVRKNPPAASKPGASKPTVSKSSMARVAVAAASCDVALGWTV
jgi:hypothetical protein